MNKKITTKDSGFISADGKEFIAHGINMVCKDKSKGYIGDYTDEDFRFLKESGFNLIRLGIFWDAVEPTPGVYGDDYLKKLDNIIAKAANADIPVFLDMHQDLYGAIFEDGAPEWATLTDGEEHKRTDLWSESYLISPAVQHAFDNFWKNTPAKDGIGIRTHFVNAWRHIASHYADNPYVVGYDLLNEPFPGTPGAEVAMIMGSVMGEAGPAALNDPEKIEELVTKIFPVTSGFEKEVLMPFYSELASVIREVDKNTMIIIESNYFANAGIPSVIEPVRDSAGDLVKFQAYAPHGYDILVDTEEYKTGGTERVDFIFGSLINGAKRTGLPTFFGEWGCYPNASEAQKQQASYLLSMFRSSGIGNVYFDFSHIRDGGILNTLLVSCSRHVFCHRSKAGR